MTMPTAPCYESTTKRYRHEMAGSPEAANLPKPVDEGADKWGTAKTKFEQMMTDIDDGLRAAEAAHEGRAADAANASISEIKPHAERIAEVSGQIKGGLRQQVEHQNEAFAALPTQGETLGNGREVQIDPPEKGWVENAGLDKNPITGWMSDYEDRQEDFRSTNDRAHAAMQRYQSQTDTNLGQLPQFQQEKPAPPPQQPPPGSGMTDANSAMSGSGYSAPPGMSGGASAPAASSSSWASAPAGGGAGTPAPSAPAPPPAATTPVGAPAPGLPPGVVRGPDGTAYRQNASGAWERQNPYNGRWAPSPAGGPGGAGGGAAGARGAGSGQPAVGGRAGVGGVGGGPGSSATGGSGTSGASGGRGGAPMGGGAGARGGQGGEEEEHERPSWLVENDDVFTNDMDRVAPPVLGDNPGGK